MAIHRLLDGGRIVEPLGPDDGEIEFDGAFTGQQAVRRARALDELRSSGTVVNLTWRSFQYQVVVRKFAANYANPWWISYCLSCVVAAQAGSLPTSTTTVEATIASDVATAAAALSGLPIQMTGISTAMGATGALVLGTSANIQAAAATASTLSMVNLAISTASQSITTTSQSQSDTNGFAASVLTQLGCVGTLAQATNGRSYVGRIAMNVRSGDG